MRAAFQSKNSGWRDFFRDPVFALLFAGSAALLLAGCGAAGPEGAREEGAEADGAPEAGDATSEWPLFRGDPEMQGVSPEALEPPLRLLWTYETEAEGAGRVPPVDATPVIAEGTVFVGTQTRNLLALDLASGELRWSFEADGPVTAPAAVHEGVVYFGDHHGFVYALELADGSERWRYETDGKIEGGVNIHPGLERGIGVLVGSHDYFLYCFDAASGEVLWKHETGNYVLATPSLVSSGGEASVIFGGCDGLLYVLPASGEGESREIEIGSYIANTSAVRDGIAYVAHNGGEILAIDIDSGEEVWRVRTGAEYTASPAADADQVYVAGPDRRLVAYDRVHGEEQWAFLAPRGMDSSPLVSGEVVWQASMDGRLYAVSRESGEELWNYEIGARMKASPALSRGTLVICGSDGVVYAFGK